MFKALKVLVLLGVLFIVTVFFFSKKSSSDLDAQKQLLTEKHCSFNWETASKEDKLSILNDFIEYSGAFTTNTNKQFLSSVAYKQLSSRLKFPSSLKINDKPVDAYNLFLSKRAVVFINPEDGTVLYAVNYTSENKIGQTVKGQFQMKVEYKAGCTNFKVLDVSVK